MPEFDDYGNYESYDYEPIYDEDKWVLIEEIRNFQMILKEFMEHPVTSEKEIKKRQMLNDLNIYQERLNLGRFFSVDNGSQLKTPDISRALYTLRNPY